MVFKNQYLYQNDQLVLLIIFSCAPPLINIPMHLLIKFLNQYQRLTKGSTLYMTKISQNTCAHDFNHALQKIPNSTHNACSTAGADPVFKRGGGNFERKMIVDTHINACTHKNQTNIQHFFSSSFSRGLSSILALFYYSLLFLKFERGLAIPTHPRSASAQNIIFTSTILVKNI